jgi:hypothetical protein
MKTLNAIVVLLIYGFNALANTTPHLQFIENKNQWDASVQYRASINSGYLSLTTEGFVFQFYDQRKVHEQHYNRLHGINEGGEFCPDESIESWIIRMSFPRGNVSSRKALGKSTEYYNYFLGNDPSRWGIEAHAYREIVYDNFYPGVDLRVYSEGPHAKYDWIVRPGENPMCIEWEYDGAASLALEDGSIYARTPLADVIEKKPIAYQVKNGIRFNIRIAFIQTGATFRYALPDGYDPCYELIIDPLLIFSTYSGATADNWGSSATPGERGTLYSTGVVRDFYQSQNGQNITGQLSRVTGSFQSTNAGGYDIALFKYDSTGGSLLWASYLGGTANESPHSLVMNNNRELLLLGTTSSSSFPTTSTAFSRSFKGGISTSPTGIAFTNGSDIVLSRISSDGKQLLASTFLGGTANDGLNASVGPLTKNYGDEQRGDVIVDSNDNVFISTVTSSANFPVMNAFDLTYNGGGSDAVVVKLNKELSTIQWATFIGGTQEDASHTMKFDNNGNLIIGGGTVSSDFPTTVGSYQTTYAGQGDGWIARLTNDGSSMLNATLTGTTGFDQVYFVDLNSEGDIYAYGQTSGTFPISPGVYNNPNSGQFIQKFDSNLSQTRFSTVFGSGIGIPNISPTAFLVNDCNNLYVSGWGGNVNRSRNYWQSGTTGMPVTSDALQRTTNGSDFYFMVLTDDATELLYATFLGGNQASIHVDGGTSRFDKGGVVYHAVCAGCGGGFDDFPTSNRAWSRLNNSQNCNNAAFKFDLSSLTARLQTNNIFRTMPGITRVCIPDAIVFQNLSTGGEIFEWDLGDGVRRVLSDTSSIVHRYQNPGTYTVKLTAIDQGTCKVRDEVTRTIVVDLAESSVQEDDGLCEGDAYTLQSSGGASYQWRDEEHKVIGSQSQVTVQPSKTSRYYVTITEAMGCVRYDSVLLSVVPAIVPDFKLIRESNCSDRPFVIVENPQADSTDYTFTFDFGDGNQTDLAEEQHGFETDSVYRIKLMAQREFCVFEEQKSVDISSLIIPNIITPKANDGKNDVFTIQYGKAGRTPADAGLKVKLLVYNRWGNVVYETEDYQYDWSGADLVTGVYFYEVTVEGYATCKDWIHLVK